MWQILTNFSNIDDNSKMSFKFHVPLKKKKSKNILLSLEAEAVTPVILQY